MLKNKQRKTRDSGVKHKLIREFGTRCWKCGRDSNSCDMHHIYGIGIN